MIHELILGLIQKIVTIEIDHSYIPLSLIFSGAIYLRYLDTCTPLDLQLVTRQPTMPGFSLNDLPESGTICPHSRNGRFIRHAN